MSVVKSWVEKVFFASCAVSKVTDVGDSFRLVELEGGALTKLRGRPGDKLQVHAAGLATMRTYTPVGWDSERGRTRLCAFVHGAGPGARWMRSLKDGDACSFFGPRGSLNLSKPSGPVVLFGDETSVGVGASLLALRAKGSHVVFEATSSRSVSLVADMLGLAAARVIARTADDQHLREAAEQIASVAPPDATILLTGRATSIVTLREHLRAAGVTAKIKAKTYWADGRSGLD